VNSCVWNRGAFFSSASAVRNVAMGRSMNTLTYQGANVVPGACAVPQADLAWANGVMYPEGQVAAWQPCSWAFMMPVLMPAQMTPVKADAVHLNPCTIEGSQCFAGQTCSWTGTNTLSVPQMIPCPLESARSSSSDDAASSHESQSCSNSSNSSDDGFSSPAKQSRKKKDPRSGQQQTHLLGPLRKAIGSPTLQAGREMDCEKLRAQLSGDSSEEKMAAIAAIEDEVVHMAFHPEGCRVVQLALEVARDGSRLKLADAFKTHVIEAALDPSANFVIQKMIEVLPVAFTSFVPKELKGFVKEVASNRHGCRIFCRLLEHIGCDETIEVIQEALQNISFLACSPYGKHVIQAMLEYGSATQRKQIVDALCIKLISYAKGRITSTVVEKALDHASEADKLHMVAELLADEKEMLAMADSQYGRFIVKALCQMPGRPSERVMEILRQGQDHLCKSKHGMSCLRDCAQIQAAK